MVKRIIKKMSNKLFNRNLDNLEKLELENNQKSYAKDTPVFIWFLKIIIVFNMLIYLLGIIFSEDLLFRSISLLMLIINGYFIFGIIKRKRWSWYFGILFYLIIIFGNLLDLNSMYIYSVNIAVINIVFGSITLIIFMIHKDYLNK